MTETERVKAELMREYQADPVFFVEHGLGHLTWSKQREILHSIRDNEWTAVRACHGVSKTYTAAEAAVWFLNCYPASKVITTAPTFPQVKMLLWAEINAIYARSRVRLEGECLMTEIKTEDKDHYAIGFSTDKPARAEGWHAPALLFVFDEAKGLPQWLWDAARGAMTGGLCRWLAISTTDGVQVGEQFHRCFSTDSVWNRIPISAFDSPYVTGEKFRTVTIPDPARPDRFKVGWTDPKDVTIQIADQKYIDDCRKEWGEESVLYLTKVKGEIVDAGADSIIKLSQVEQMFANGRKADFDSTGEEEVGIDVARGGADDTVMFRRKGLKVTAQKTITSKQLPEKEKLEYLADEAEIFVGRNKKARLKIDDTGVGGGLVDILQRRKYNVIPVNFGAAAKDPDRYPNTISEMWYEAGAIVQEIACSEDNRLRAELVNRKGLPLDKKGRRQVEPKKDYKERFGRSPDEADAFLLAFYNPVLSIADAGTVNYDVRPA